MRELWRRVYHGPPLLAEERIEAGDGAAAERLALCLQRFLAARLTENSHELVVLCIGTDRSTGDALGPLVGTLLAEGGLETEGPPGAILAAYGVRRLALYGTLDCPVHAANLEEALSRIEQTHYRPFTIAIDACLGRLENVGTIAVGPGPLRPGAGVNKVLPAAGNIYVTGTVNVGGMMEYFVLQNTRLSLVMKMARVIASAMFSLTRRACARTGDPDIPAAAGRER